MKPARRAELALLVVTLTWGLTFPLIKGALSDSPPFSFLALRFGLGFLLFLAAIRGARPSRAAWGPGILLAVLLGGSYYAQTLGLVHTTSTRSAFITGLSVILVPLFYPVITRRAPGWWPSLGAVLACGGMFLLTDPEAGGLNRGDVFTLFCALGYALYIVVLEVMTRRHPYRELLAVQMLVLSVAFLPAALVEGGPVRWTAPLLVGVAGTAVILVVSMVLQNRFQKDTTATRAAVIFAAEPVFAAVFSFAILGEVLGPVQWGGGMLILLGILAAERR